MDDTIRWTVKVSRSTDTSLRSHLAQKGLKKGDLSKFIEEAVRWRVFHQTVEDAKERNANVPQERTGDAGRSTTHSAAVRAERSGVTRLMRVVLDTNILVQRVDLPDLGRRIAYMSPGKIDAINSSRVLSSWMSFDA